MRKKSPAAAKRETQPRSLMTCEDLSEFMDFDEKLFCSMFILPQSDCEVVGTCKLDTHGFNTNDLQNINLYFENIIFFRPKQKYFFGKSQNPTFSKSQNRKI